MITVLRFSNLEVGRMVTWKYAVVQDGDRERFFVQKKGLAMGKAFSPVVADLVMGEWEADLKELAREAGCQVLEFARYADDYLVLFMGGRDQLDNFVRKLNTKDTSIQVEAEVESGMRLPFLDISIQRTRRGFQTQVFRKASNSGQVTPYSSYTHPSYLRAGIVSYATRAYRYSSTLALRQREVDYLRAQFRHYGYPDGLVRRVILRTFANLDLKKRALPAPQIPEETMPLRISFPYTGRSFDQLRRAASTIGIQLVSKPMGTLRSQLSSRAKHKLPLEQESGIVYLVRCSCQPDGSSALYVGETERELAQRVKEHRDGWRLGTQNSAFGGHAQCQPDFAGASVLARQPHRRLRLLYESAFIRAASGRDHIIVSPNDQAINRNSGLILDQRWLPLIAASCHIPQRPEPTLEQGTE